MRALGGLLAPDSPEELCCRTYCIQFHIQQWVPGRKRARRARLDNPPPAPKIEPYKTHLAYVKERRSDKEAEDILDEALELLRSRRKAGEIIF